MVFKNNYINVCICKFASIVFMGELIASLLELVAEIGLTIQEFFFRKKKKRRRAYEKANNLPIKRMISPNQRVYILLAVLGFISFLIIIFFPSSSNKQITIKKLTEIKELLEKEKQVFGKYPNELRIIIRNNPLRENLLEDGWNNTFIYEIKENGAGYFLISCGNDEVFKTEDDIFIVNN